MGEGDAYDYDLIHQSTPMDEEFFEDPDETLVNSLVDVSEVCDPNEREDNPLVIDEDEDDPLTIDQDEEDPPAIDNDEDDGDYNDDRDGNDTPPPGNLRSRWSDDTLQTEEMSRFGICVNTAARVLVCIACATVIKPHDLRHHFSKTHPPISIPATFCQEVIDTYDLHLDPLRLRPGRIITAIYGLDVVDGYFTCDTCGYAYQTENRIKTHVGKSQRCTRYRRRYAQAFRTNNRMYFGVDLQHTPDQIEDPLDPVDYLKTKFAPPPFNQVPIQCPEPCDTNHFLNLEQWHKHIVGRAPGEVHRVVRVREPELRKEVRIVVERYARDAVKKLEKVDNEVKGAIGDYLG